MAVSTELVRIKRVRSPDENDAVLRTSQQLKESWTEQEPFDSGRLESSLI